MNGISDMYVRAILMNKRVYFVLLSRNNYKCIVTISTQFQRIQKNKQLFHQ